MNEPFRRGDRAWPGIGRAITERLLAGDDAVMVADRGEPAPGWAGEHSDDGRVISPAGDAAGQPSCPWTAGGPRSGSIPGKREPAYAAPNNPSGTAQVARSRTRSPTRSADLARRAS